MDTLDSFARRKLEELDGRGTRRRLVETWREDGIRVRRGGRMLVSFSCNDYFNLTHHPAVKRAAIDAIERYGAGAGASRLVTGNHPLYQALEERLARFKGTEAAIVFGSGYLANVSIPPALVGPGDLVLVDSLAHSSIHAGATLGGAWREVFRHNDLDHLADLLHEHRASHGRVLVLTDRVFSMDGDLAPIGELAELARRWDAWLLADDAHGTGILPPPDPNDVPLLMGTLSKALGSYGGFLCATQPVIELLHSRARAFVYTTGLPPASVAAALAALDLIEDRPDWAARPLARAQDFAKRLNLPAPQSQIVPVIIGESDAAMEASRRLEEAGFLVTAIRPPTVPEGTARLRVTFTAGHGEAEVAALADAVRDVL
ncbi:MAG TPA: 8-amino-7-oxononanoate synthase [Stellaceae bacterium]|nr:8-amino-7-oxononanoate synthase [Stellaceae bacterium]